MCDFENGKKFIVSFERKTIISLQFITEISHLMLHSIKHFDSLHLTDTKMHLITHVIYEISNIEHSFFVLQEC